jgi:uncharacterized protein YndB with AHSA1/START domain
VIEIDVDQQIAAVGRTVGDRVIEAGEMRIITVSQSYDTDPDDLWDAVTNAERIPRWFLPITGDLKPGGSYQLEAQAGGTVLTCDPPENFTATWEFAGNVSWIDVRVTGEGGGRSRLVLEHIIPVADDEMWGQFGPGAVGMGWDSMLLGLALHLDTGQSVDPSFGQEWLGTADGKRFLSRSGDEWYAANVALGTDREVARAMADRCLKAYLGEQ